ncbi:sensor histidine kinase [Paenibacillus cymbidii]|uniref:sensor histidine kinase n=1 Tax=Paenibacillus cymbidii TaxID=1639034 RepID=UPI001081098B|nr:histidine kinase [Paenibacillus cymbidii]
MAKLRKLFGRLFSRMFVKLFLALALASLLAFAGLLYSALGSSREALMRQKSDDMTMFMERTGQYLDLYLQNIRSMLINMSERLDERALADPTELQHTLQQQIERSSGIAANLFVKRRDGSIVASNQLAYGIVGHPRLPDLFRIADETPGVVKWSEPYYSPLQTNSTVAFALSLKDGSGSMLAEINTSLLTRRLYELLGSSGQGFALFTNAGRIVAYDANSAVVPYRPATLPPEMDESFVRALIGLPDGISRVDGATGPLMAVKSKRNEIDWYLIAMTDERDFRAGSRGLLLRFLGIGAIWFSLLIVLALAISRQFATPVNRLALQMDRIRGERFDPPPRQIARTDEIGRLSRSFYLLLERIRELLDAVRVNEERKKELEMALLLHQIRPHFLYNTLACVGSLARQHRVDEVQETIRSLIGLLTYSIDRSEFATLEEERLSLQAYMQIQNVRYGDAFRYEERIDPACAAARLPKLLLQPLVENALFHGLAAKGEGTVLMTAAAAGDRLLLTVRDDGAGMTAAQIEAVLSPRNPAAGAITDASHERTDGRFKGIALPNVQERIRLHYGPAYGLRIRSEPGEWTEVTVELPLEAEAPPLSRE